MPSDLERLLKLGSVTPHRIILNLTVNYEIVLEYRCIKIKGFHKYIPVCLYLSCLLSNNQYHFYRVEF